MSDIAKTAFVYIGAGVASYFAPPLAPLFFAAAGMAAAAINQPDVPDGPRLNDTGYSGSSYGVPIMRGWGTFPAAANYIWAPPLRETEHEHGGKGGSEFSTYTYNASFAVLLAEGPITQVRRLWFDTELVFDAREDSNGAYQHEDLYMDVYLGDGDQLPDPLIESYEGVGNVPAWRNYCYIVVDDFPLKNYGNRRPNIRAELVRTPFQDTNRVVTLDKGSSTPRYSEIDGTVVTYQNGDNGMLYRWDRDTRELLGSTKAGSLGQTNVYLVDDDGWVYGWEWEPNAPLNHWFPKRVHILTGEVVRNGCASNMDICGWTPCPSPEPGSQCCEENNFDAVHMIRKIRNGFWYFVGNSSIEAVVIDPKRCPYTWTRIGGYTGLRDACEDSDGNIWFTYLSGTYADNIVIDAYPAGTYAFDISALFSQDSPQKMMWHVPSQSMIIDTTQGVTRFSFDGTNLTREAGPGHGSHLSFYDLRYLREPDLWVAGSVFQFIHLDAWTLETIRILSPIPDWQAFLHRGDPIYIKTSNSIFGMGNIPVNTFNQLLLDRYPAGDQALSLVVAELSRDMKPERVDVSDLDDLVHGFPITRQEDIRQSIARLMPTHLFGAVESDATIKYLHIPRDPVVTIPEDDLAAHVYGNEIPDQTVITRKKDNAFPRRIEVSYISYEREYEVMTQGASRQHTFATEIAKVQFTEVITDDEAVQTAEKLLHTPPDERNEHRFELSNKYLYLDPLDEVILTKGDATFRVRILQTDWTTPGIVKCNAISTEPASYDSTAVGASTLFDGATVITTTKQSFPWLMDAPLLSASEDVFSPGYYTGVTSDASTTFSGATLLRLESDEAVGGVVQTTMTVETDAGRATTVLPDTDNTTTWDDVSTVTVQLQSNGELSSSTDADVINGANGAMLGTELIQFVNVTDNGNSSYTLSRLLRGRRGTEWATGDHAISEQFVAVSVPDTYNVYTTLATMGVEHYYRAVSFGLNYANAPFVAFTNNNIRLKPFSPVQANVTYDGDLNFTWVRRTRQFIPPIYTWIPLGEASEAYELDIYDLNGDVARTITATSESATYTNAQLLSDFGAAGVTGFDFAIYQISASIGRGYPLYGATTDFGIYLPLATDFSEYTTGSEVLTATDWTNNTPSPYVQNQIVEDGAAVGGKYLNQDSNPSTFEILTWDRSLPSPQVEVLVEFFTILSSHAEQNGVMLRYQQTSVNGYVANISAYYGEGILWNIKSPSHVMLAITSGKGLSGRSWIRFRIEGDLLKAKFWSGTFGAEPSSWDLTVTDTDYATGMPALYSLNDTAWDQFAIAYNGDTAVFS